VADFLQAQRAARELLEDRLTSVNFAGFSFGGALALMAAALSREPRFVAVGQPTFGWNRERRRLALGGSTQQINEYIARYPWRLDAVMRTLEFFDTVHFAPLIRADVLVGIGLDDNVVPSRTVLAIVNHLTSRVEVRLLPVSHSHDPREHLWREFHEEWLGYIANELPAEFGHTGRQVRTLVA
jgi:cephalosporin-C deacetylase